ncbi:MAG: leucine-rich repeat protein, partial [Paludibacteraceae bacterium]|nr:leucine-rich repeat protein [Paludibacteraceae bacterium]
VILNDSLKRIDDGAFCQCRSLREVVWNDSLTYIGADAFLDCKHLPTPIVDPSIEVGKNAFKGCKERR